MADVREDILARLIEVVATIPNIWLATRNNVDITEDQMPAAIVLDGDEDLSGSPDLSAHPSNKPVAIQMTPTIMILHQDPNVGAEIGELRRELIKRVLLDTELNEQIVKTGVNGNGAIRYLGCEVGTAWLRDLHGAMTARFMFKYWLKPNEL